MATVKIADLKNNLSRHLARVRQGAELTVLDRDVPIARVVPFTPRQGGPTTERDSAAAESRQRLAELQRLGVVESGDPEGLADRVRTLAPVELPTRAPGAVDLLLRMRRESQR